MTDTEEPASLCTFCLSESILVTSGGFLVVGLGKEDEVALVYHPKPQIPSFDEHDLPELPAPGYIAFEQHICEGCGHVLQYVPQDQLELLNKLRSFVQKVNEIEQKRYGLNPTDKDAEDVQNSGGSEPGD